LTFGISDNRIPSEVNEGIFFGIGSGKMNRLIELAKELS